MDITYSTAISPMGDKYELTNFLGVGHVAEDFNFTFTISPMEDEIKRNL